MNASKNILILASQIPFSRGGAELLNERLKQAFIELGHRADILSLPFLCNNHADLFAQIAQWRSLNLEKISGRDIDLVIATKFPTYFVKTPKKIVWLVHQHRQAYELFGTRFGDFTVSDEDEAIRAKLLEVDQVAFKESRANFAISSNVASRLKEFLDIDSEVIEPALPWDLPSEAFNLSQIVKGTNILVVGRLCSSKRVEIIIRALAKINSNLSLQIVGAEDELGYLEFLKNEVSRHHLDKRVEFLGTVSSGKLSDLYRNCFCVYYGSFDEDYGFVSYEAATVFKPVVTLRDSGYAAEVINRFGSGVVCESSSNEVANQINLLYFDQSLYDLLQEHSLLVRPSFTWRQIVDKFLGVM